MQITKEFLEAEIQTLEQESNKAQVFTDSSSSYCGCLQDVIE
jgi:hypothetical protein